MASVPHTLPALRAARSRSATMAFARRHALFLGLFGVGAALRAITTAAYSPALLINDSEGFLSIADHLVPDEFRPAGYSLLIWALPDHLSLVVALQHLMGLGAGVVIYVLLNRLGVPRWGSALAAAPVLL